MPLHLTTAGSPARPALLMLHGFMGHGADWRDLAADLAPQRYCLMPDLPGHGASLDRDDYAVEATAAALIDLLDASAIPRADLLGYSLGGRVALFTALTYPERIGRLVLESASAGLAEPELRRHRLAADQRRAESLRRDGVAAFVDAWFEQPLFASLHRRPERLARMKRQRLHNDAEGLARSLEGVGTGRYPSQWERLRNLEASVLLVCGELDAKFHTLNRDMAGLMCRARLARVAEAGHNVHLEQPAAFASHVRAFLTE